MLNHHTLFLSLVLLLTVTACAGGTALPLASVSPTMVPKTATPVPTPTPHPPRLVLCTTEPEIISPFSPSQAGLDILALFYEEPLERVDYQWEPRLVDDLPTFDNGNVITQTTTVLQGARYADETGAIQIHEGARSLSLPQMTVTFTLKSDLRWSDGEPLTTEDALLGYHLAQASEARGRWKELVERTESFVALDDHSVQWTGIPGYVSVDYPGFFFPPQPAHRWKDLQLSEILMDNTPPGTGPFTIERWETERGITLRPNPYYAGSQPVMEEIIVRFPQLDVTQWPKLITSGECDIVLPDPATEVDWRTWELLMAQGEVLIWANTGYQPIFLRMDFNLDPPDRATTPLSNLTVRMAIASCIDRNRLVKALPSQALRPAESFLPPEHPAFAGSELYRISYQPQTGKALLEEVGWRDEDGDGIREAHGVSKIADGKPLSLTLYLAPQYTVAAANIAADLESCGIGLIPKPTDVRLLYASDGVSPLFGRQFDLALFGWWTDAPQVCGAWRSDRIPEEDNQWIGENFSGYSSERYDEACRQALAAETQEKQYEALRQAGVILSQELPTLFLTWKPFWFVAQPQIRGIQPDSSNPAAIWNIEALSLEK